ncbi:uncharacterized protein LOC126692295 [Quercus robur]|uniref:uncharacterized protein LOC126692295 n=1 Tax=Quercus robur TaxID=38942 RepID=UPI00216295E1|nr:uncharacterized protein LOC126692295 [Quercus robur]
MVMFMAMATPPKPTIIEINLISAQDLPSYKESSIKTYVVAWISPQKKLTSRVDYAGNRNPTWNDKFIFAINKDLVFHKPNTTLVLEIYSKRPYRKDRRIGKVHILLESLMDKTQHIMAFHVRDSSSMPQGILNLGIMNLDGLFNRSIPTYLGSSLAIDYRKLMGVK